MFSNKAKLVENELRAVKNVKENNNKYSQSTF
jgi:hypothetical protein